MRNREEEGHRIAPPNAMHCLWLFPSRLTKQIKERFATTHQLSRCNRCFAVCHEGPGLYLMHDSKRIDGSIYGRKAK